MNAPLPRLRERLLLSGSVLLAVLLVGWALLRAYGLDLLAAQPPWWRDHPFDFGNIQFTLQTWSLQTRLWAYDPLHLFGWTPNVFYNPLATCLGALFVGAGGGGSGAYWGFLVAVLLLTPLAFLPWLPTGSRLGFVAGGVLASLASLLVYPMDVGLLDANPVQVLYTGQWAQRLGLALGLLAIERFWRALQVLDRDYRLSLRRSIAAALLLGAALFSHYMCGYGTIAVLALLSLHRFLAGRLVEGRFHWITLLALPVVLLMMGALFLDFFAVFLSANASLHGLPLLEWSVPQGALDTVREVVIPCFPVLLVPLLALLRRGQGREVFSQILFPLLVLLLVSEAEVAWLGPLFLLLFGVSLLASWLERDFSPRHFLPVAAFFLLWLAAGPDSFKVFGLDLGVLVPFAASIGFAKLAALSRFLFLAWFGWLVADALSKSQSPRVWLQRLSVCGLALASLAVPLLLSLDRGEAAGAQSFFGWMNATDATATRSLLERFRESATEIPSDHYLLAEDTLHHPEGSLLPANVPNGHLPYLAASIGGHPILGGSVTTRTLTHPLEHTSRGQLLCTDFTELAKNPVAVLDRLRTLGVSAVLAHSPDLVRALESYPLARRVDQAAGLARFELLESRSLLSDGAGKSLLGARLAWRPDGIDVTLPAGTSSVQLRQVLYPFLACEARGPSGPLPCKLSAWTDGPETFASCRLDRPQSLTIEVPWIQVNLEPDAGGPVEVQIRSRPPLLPFVAMVVAWAGALGLALWSRRGSRGVGPVHPEVSHGGG